MKIPNGIARGHVIAATEFIDNGLSTNFGSSRRYDLLYEGRRYAPKAVLGLAAQLLTGKEYYPQDFSCGQGSKCFKVLQELEFHIVKKSSPDKDPMQRASVRHLMGLGIRPS